MDDYDDQVIFGDLMGLEFPDICITGEENPEENLTPHIQGAREISAILLTVVGDGWKDLTLYIYIYIYIYGSEGWLGFPDLWSGQKTRWN